MHSNADHCALLEYIHFNVIDLLTMQLFDACTDEKKWVEINGEVTIWLNGTKKMVVPTATEWANENGTFWPLDKLMLF